MQDIVYYVKLTNSCFVGNWPTRKEAIDSAASVWGLSEESVVAMPPPHDWQSCQCQTCRGQREADAFLTTPCRFTP